MEGDRNTKFFHSYVQKRKQKLHIFRIRNELGNWCMDKDEIERLPIDSFKSQLNSQHMSEENDLLDNIPSLLNYEEKTALSKFPTLEELYEVIKSMDQNSAPGPDGFNGYFYIYCWDIIKEDLFNAFLEFFAGGILPKSWTSTYLLPIPKVDNPSSLIPKKVNAWATNDLVIV